MYDKRSTIQAKETTKSTGTREDAKASCSQQDVLLKGQLRTRDLESVKEPINALKKRAQQQYY